LDVNDAINFVIEEVEQPALDHPDLEEKFKGKVRSSRTVARQMKKIGDLYQYLKRFENIVPEGSPGRDLYDRFQALGLKTYEELFPEFAEKFTYYLEDVTTIDDFIVDQTYTSWDIAIFARHYNTMPGIYTIGEEPYYQAIFVKATFEQGKYPYLCISKRKRKNIHF